MSRERWSLLGILFVEQEMKAVRCLRITIENDISREIESSVNSRRRRVILLEVFRHLA